jgi:Kef-type K+ transport system membrane component KefB
MIGTISFHFCRRNRLEDAMRLVESAIGIGLVALTFLLAMAGLITDLFLKGDPPALFGVAAVTGIAAVGVALDEHRRTARPYRLGEVLLGRGLLTLSVILGLVSFVLAVDDSAYRNLWLGLAIIVGLVGVAVVVDSRRLVLARAGNLVTRSVADAILGAISAALGLGFGIAGVLAGLADNPHASTCLDVGVVLGVLAVALMLDEQAHVVARGRKRPSF